MAGKENPVVFTGFEQRVGFASFITDRGDVITDGHEAIVYQRKDLDFVIKELVDLRAIDGYRLAVELLDGQLVATAFFDSLRIRVDFRDRVIQGGVVQERISPLEDEFQRLIKKKDVERLSDLIRKKARLDKEILARGVFVQDPELKNSGLTKTDAVVLFDPGRAVGDPSCDEWHLTRLINRGWTHYSIYMRLQDWETHQLKNVVAEGQLSNLYRQETGLTFDPKINASTHLLIVLTSFEDLARFMGKTLGNLAQEELDKSFPLKIPPHPEVELLGSGHLDDEWEISGGLLIKKSS